MKIMVIVAHPNLENSRANRALMQQAKQNTNGNVDIRDLYKEYPDWNIDIEREQQLILQYDRVVFQFPFYWYSCPPLLKKWFDDVLTFGWAFGPEGNSLRGRNLCWRPRRQAWNKGIVQVATIGIPPVNCCVRFKPR